MGSFSMANSEFFLCVFCLKLILYAFFYEAMKFDCGTDGRRLVYDVVAVFIKGWIGIKFLFFMKICWLWDFSMKLFPSNWEFVCEDFLRKIKFATKLYSLRLGPLQVARSSHHGRYLSNCNRSHRMTLPILLNHQTRYTYSCENLLFCIHFFCLFLISVIWCAVCHNFAMYNGSLNFVNGDTTEDRDIFGDPIAAGGAPKWVNRFSPPDRNWMSFPAYQVVCRRFSVFDWKHPPILQRPHRMQSAQRRHLPMAQTKNGPAGALPWQRWLLRSNRKFKRSLNGYRIATNIYLLLPVWTTKTNCRAKWASP